MGMWNNILTWTGHLQGYIVEHTGIDKTSWTYSTTYSQGQDFKTYSITYSHGQNYMNILYNMLTWTTLHGHIVQYIQ